MRHKVGGFMLWSIDTDDFHGDCEKERLQIQESAPGKYSYPLLREIHRAIQQYRESKDDVEIPEIDTNDVLDTKITPKKPTSVAQSIFLAPKYLSVISIISLFIL